MTNRKLMVLRVIIATLSMGFIQNGQCSLVGHWPLNSINSGSTPDISGFGTAADGSVVGGAYIVTDAVRGNVLSLDGTTGYINIPDAGKLNPTSVTLMAWVKVWKWNGSYCAIVNKAPQFEIKSAYAQTWQGVAKLGTSTRTLDGGFRFNPEDWGWHHLAMTAGGGFIKIYYDGELVNSVAASGSVPTTLSALQIGAYLGGNLFKGRISDVRLYDAVLSQTEIESVIAGTRTIGTLPSVPTPGDKLVTYTAPSTETLSRNYTITVNGMSVPVVKYTARRNLNWGVVWHEDRSVAICHFSFVGKANIAVTVSPSLPALWTLSPASQNIVPNINGNTLTFGVSSPQNLVLHYNGAQGISNSDGINEKLVIIADKLEDRFPILSDSLTRNALTGYGADNTGTFWATTQLQSCIDAAAEVSGVAYIPAGVYNVDAPLFMRNNVTVYLDGGAVIRATTVKITDCFFKFDGVSNAKLLGRGTIDLRGSHYRLDTSVSPDFNNAQGVYILNGAKNNEVEGITFRDGANIHVWIMNSPKNYIHNIKIIADGDYPNTDGIDAGESPFTRVNDVFVMNTDDPATIGYEGENHDCNYTNSRFWTRNGGLKTNTAGYVTSSPNNHDQTWENIDMIRASKSTCIEAEKGFLSNLYFKNIRMEYPIEGVTGAVAESGWTGSVDGVYQMNITAPNFGYPYYTHNSNLFAQPGYMFSNVTFNNLIIAGELITDYSGYNWLDYDTTTLSNVVFSSSNNTQVEITSGNALYATESENGTLSFILTGDMSETTTVNFEVGGTAVMGTDYQIIPYSVTFEPGVSRQDVSIVPTAQGLLNGPKSVVAIIKNAPLSTKWMVGPNYQAHVSIASTSTYTVSGTVSLSGSGLTGVIVSDGSHIDTTAVDGTYTLGNVPNGIYTLTPVSTDYTFTPASLSVTVNEANLTDNNFTATAIVHSPPDAPTIGTAKVTGVSGHEATVSFTAPANNGGSAIIDYTATSNPDGITANITQSGSGSITVTGLTIGTTYTFTVTACNAIGSSVPSDASNPVTPCFYIPETGTAYRWYSMATATANSTRLVEPRLKDGNTTSNVWLKGGTKNSNETSPNTFEAAGMIYSTSKTITRFIFVNGAYYGGIEDNGCFDSELTVQTTTDGITWEIGSGWTISPAYQYNNASVSGAAFTFTGSASNITGIRVCGKVYTSSTHYSWEAGITEITPYSSSFTTLSTVSSKAEDVVVYPNPATSKLTIGNLNENSSIRVVGLDGREISKQNAVENAVVFDVSNWKKGMYLLNIQNGNKTLVKKAVIQ